MASRPFVRVYHDDFMRDYPTIYADDAALSTWLRLLVIADKMWPAVPELPRSVRARNLEMLTKVGLVLIVPPHSYQVRGYDAERQARQDVARSAAAVRWQSKGNADAYAKAMPTPVPVPRPVPDTESRTSSLKRGVMESTGTILPRVLPERIP